MTMKSQFFKQLSVLSMLALLSGCHAGIESFCAQTGYQPDTPQYEACSQRYKDRYYAYNFCTQTKNINKEGTVLKNCVFNIAPKVEQRFVVDQGQCGVSAQQEVLRMRTAVSTGQTITINNADTLNAKNSGEDKREQDYKEERRFKDSLVASCMNSKGWRDADAWWRNSIIPNFSEGSFPEERREFGE
jgi:hypothetical protein